MEKKKASTLDEQMLIVRDFIDEFYNKTSSRKEAAVLRPI